MAKTLGEYLKSLGILGWLLMVLNLFTALGALEFYTETRILQNFPTWGWIVLLGVGLIAMPFRAFHKVRVQRDELQAKLQQQLKTIPGSTPNIPKLASPELYITYLKHEFGVAGEGKYIDISVGKGTPVLSVEAEFRPTGQMRIEAVKLCLVGLRILSLNDKVQESSEQLWFMPSNIFNISGISSGKHGAELIALANGKWWRSHSFSIEINS